MLRRLLGIFLVSTLLIGLLGTGTAPTWSSVVVLALAFGFYVTTTFLSIVTWSAARGDSPERWPPALGPDAPAIVSSFSDLARQHIGVVIGTTLLSAVGFGAGLWGWFQIQYFGPALSSDPLMILVAGAAICGTMAGPGLGLDRRNLE